MQYVSYINSLIKQKLFESNNVISYGQNIAAGSCLGGLTRNINKSDKNLVLNTTNSEYSMTGVGFGLMLEGLNSIYFHKQQDFTLLGMDHFVHTWNAISISEIKGSYTIFSIVVDNGYEGPQSCTNILRDLSSISNIPGYTISNAIDAEYIINYELIKPGVRFVCVSQKMFKTEIQVGNINSKLIDKENCVSRYSDGNDVIILSMNFAFSEAMKLHNELLGASIKSSVLNIASTMPKSWDIVLKELKNTKKIVICDDSKSNNKELYKLCYLLSKQIKDCLILIKDRERYKSWAYPNPDLFKLDYKKIIKELRV
jgi:pyruvate/2-oxoglutarate/acetoin dehydrogenase E1 component